MIRHLLYNCWAAAHTEEWRLNVERLCRFGSVFNGKKVVVIKTGPGVAELDVVREAFLPLGDDVEFVEWPNDPGIGEAAGFVPALERFRVEHGALFYAHTKGVKYGPYLPVQYLMAIRRWRNRMYHECLSDIGRVEGLLQDFACCGCFLYPRSVPPVPANARWHFAGTFWWVNLERLFSVDWRDVDRHTHGVEGYLGKLFPVEQAASLFEMPPKHKGGLYSIKCFYICECGHEFAVWPKMSGEPVKVCKKCFKRKAKFSRVVPDTVDV